MPYGEAIIDEHNTDYENPFKFTGMELDPTTGLYDHGVRQRYKLSKKVDMKNQTSEQILKKSIDKTIDAGINNSINKNGK